MTRPYIGSSYDGWRLHEVKHQHRRRLIHRVLTGVVQVALLIALGALFGLAIVMTAASGPITWWPAP